MTKLTGGITKALSIIVGLVPTMTALASIHGQSAQEQQATIASAAVAGLDTVEGLTGKSFADDADVQAAARDVTDAVQRFHAIVTAKHTLATTAAK